jgi:hypothetical protein
MEVLLGMMGPNAGVRRGFQLDGNNVLAFAGRNTAETFETFVRNSGALIQRPRSNRPDRNKGTTSAGGTMTNAFGSQWQLIATAPHGEPILVFSARWGTMIATFRPEFNAWFSRMQCPASLNDADSELITHWMPLPARPDVSQHLTITRPAPATGLPASLARFIERASTREAA